MFTPGTNDYAGSNGSLDPDQSVTAVSTTTVVESSATPSVFGGPVTFTATVTEDGASSATPVGSVQFKSDGNDLGSPVTLDGSGQAPAVDLGAAGGRPRHHGGLHGRR